MNATIALVDGTLNDGVGIGTIVDDDLPPYVAISDASVTEGNSGIINARFVISLSAASGKKVIVRYKTFNGTAVAPDDYTAIPASVGAARPVLTFLPGETIKVITVAVKGDTIDEANEKFRVILSGAIRATLKAVDGTLTDRQGVCVIVDDDGGTPASPSAPGGSTGSSSAVSS